MKESHTMCHYPVQVVDHFTVISSASWGLIIGLGTRSIASMSLPQTFRIEGSVDETSTAVHRVSILWIHSSLNQCFHDFQHWLSDVGSPSGSKGGSGFTLSLVEKKYPARLMVQLPYSLELTPPSIISHPYFLLKYAAEVYLSLI